MAGYDLNLCICGGQARIEVYHATHIGKVGAVVRCQKCNAMSALKGISRVLETPTGIATPVDDMSITKGIKEAVIDWNARNPKTLESDTA